MRSAGCRRGGLRGRELAHPGRGPQRRLRPHVVRHFRRVPGWLDDVAESEEVAEEALGAGEARERAVTAAAPRSQQLGLGPVRLSAPRGCESAAAAAAEEESVGGRRAGGSAEDEAAAGCSRRGGGRRAVAATTAPGPGGRARAHGERCRGPTLPPRACIPVPPLAARAGLARPGKPGGRVEPRGRPKAPSGWACGAGTPGAGRRHFRALPDPRTPRPECLGLLPPPGAK